MVKEGNKAPYFCLSGLDEKGEEKEISLKDFKGKIVFLYFYTKNNAPGCTQEACHFRANIKRLQKKELQQQEQAQIARRLMKNSGMSRASILLS